MALGDVAHRPGDDGDVEVHVRGEDGGIYTFGDAAYHRDRFARLKSF